MRTRSIYNWMEFESDTQKNREINKNYSCAASVGKK